jgi:hypothetical protein
MKNMIKVNLQKKLGKKKAVMLKMEN